MNGPATGEQLHRTAWIILGSMVAGVAALAVVAGVVRQQSASPLPWLAIWILIGPVSVVLARVLLARQIAPSAPRAGADGGTGGRPPPRTVLTAHAVAWALIEGPALLGGVAYLLGAPATVLVAALVTAAVGFAITAPKREAFGLR